jgi:hypothetical protein
MMKHKLFEEKVRCTIGDLPPRPAGLTRDELEQVFGGFIFGWLGDQVDKAIEWTFTQVGKVTDPIMLAIGSW